MSSPRRNTAGPARARPSDQRRVFRCEGYGDCSMSFTRAEHLARHIRKHTGDRPYECDVCHKFFSRADNLRQHRDAVHTGAAAATGAAAMPRGRRLRVRRATPVVHTFPTVQPTMPPTGPATGPATGPPTESPASMAPMGPAAPPAVPPVYSPELGRLRPAFMPQPAPSLPLPTLTSLALLPPHHAPDAWRRQMYPPGPLPAASCPGASRPILTDREKTSPDSASTVALPGVHPPALPEISARPAPWYRLGSLSNALPPPGTPGRSAHGVGTHPAAWAAGAPFQASNMCINSGEMWVEHHPEPWPDSQPLQRREHRMHRAVGSPVQPPVQPPARERRDSYERGREPARRI